MANDQQSDFLTGLVVGAVAGGVVGGLLGVVLAPKLSQVLERRRDRQTTKQLRGSGGEEDVEMIAEMRQDADQAIAKARRSLEEKIDRLNDAIEDTRAKLAAESNNLKSTDFTRSHQEF